MLDEKIREIGKEVDRQAQVGEKGPKSAGNICRACFRSFERYRKLQAGLLDNMEKAIAAIGMRSESTIGQKRPRASDCERCSTSDKRLRLDTGSDNNNTCTLQSAKALCRKRCS